MNKVQIGNATMYLGDCLATLRGMADNSVDSIVTDPPYGLSFMGKKWDYDVPSVDVWAECLRVLKPGGHLLAFSGTRTQHRMAVRIEDAGFEIRDMIAWVYGSGFPKSLDVSKAIDKAAGAERGTAYVPHCDNQVFGEGKGKAAGVDRTPGANLSEPPVTDAASQWQGWGTALKPALEPITVARKPLTGTVASNVLEWGTGALNVDGCRVGSDGGAKWVPQGDKGDGGQFGGGIKDGGIELVSGLGRWPANLIHDGSDEVLAGFPDTGPSKAAMRGDHQDIRGGGYGSAQGKKLIGTETLRGHDDTGGSAARFFYCAKASQEDRDAGLDGLDAKATAFGNQAQAELNRGNLDHDDGKSGMNKVKMRKNIHPTVKPTDLMRYLCRLVTPPGGTVLDPFNGSGSTGKAAVLEGFAYIGCELDPAYIEISRARIEYALALRASGADKLHPASERDDKTVDLFS